MRQTILTSMFALMFLLAACGGGTASDADAPAEPTTDPAAEIITEPTAAPADDAAASEPTEAMEATEPTEAMEAATEDTASDDAGTASGGDAQTYVIVPEESQVEYEVDETFFREGTRLATAIGVTQIISGEITVDQDNPQNSSIGTMTIDISAFTSDSERRDNAIRDRWLESATYPIATFEPTEVTGLPETYTEGEELSFAVTGDLTIREATQPTTFEVTGVVENGELTGAATTELLMTDFGFDPPDIAGVLRSEDEVLLTFDFVARPEA